MYRGEEGAALSCGCICTELANDTRYYERTTNLIFKNETETFDIHSPTNWKLIKTGSLYKNIYKISYQECEVRTASYGPSFFLPSRAWAIKTRKEEMRIPQLTVRTEQIWLIRCLLYGFVDYSGFDKDKVIKS